VVGCLLNGRVRVAMLVALLVLSPDLQRKSVELIQKEGIVAFDPSADGKQRTYAGIDIYRGKGLVH